MTFSDNKTMTFFMISCKYPIFHRHHIPLITQILLRKISKFQASIIIRWKDSPRKYWKVYRNLIVSMHIYWWNIYFEKLCLIELVGIHGIMTIDGNVVKDLNITDLINDAMRERKLWEQWIKISLYDYSVYWIYFLHWWEIKDCPRVFVNSVKLRPRVNFTPFISKTQVYGEHEEGEKRINYKDEENSLILSDTWKNWYPPVSL